MENIKYYFFFSVCLFFAFSVDAQKKYVEEAISTQRKSGDYYVVHIPEKKSYSDREIYSYAKDNDLYVCNLTTRTISEFGVVKSVIASFNFMSAKQKAIYDEITAINSKESCISALAKYSLEKQRIENTYANFIIQKIPTALNAYSDFVEVFPNDGYITKINDVVYASVSKGQLPNISFNNIKSLLEKHPQLKNGFMEKAVYDYCLKSGSESNYANFISLFPNGSYTNQMKGKLENNYTTLISYANANPSVYSAAELERKALGVISNMNEAKLFASRFPNSNNVKRQKLSPDDYTTGTYIGNLVSGRREGKGYFFSNDQKYTYQGDWKNDMREGTGVEYVAGDYGYTYSGGFKNNKFNGYGKYNSTFSYEGLYYNGRFEGQGTLTDRDNLGSFTHTGLFSNDDAHGKGKRSYTDGSWYDGTWLNGNKEGEFEVRLKEGIRLYGMWRKNRPVGTHQVKKWLLGGFVPTYEGTAVFDENGKSSVTTQFDINTSSGSNSSNNTLCYDPNTIRRWENLTTNIGNYPIYEVKCITNGKLDYNYIYQYYYDTSNEYYYSYSALFFNIKLAKSKVEALNKLCRCGN